MFRGNPRKLKYSLFESRLSLINPEEFDEKANIQLNLNLINLNPKEKSTIDYQNISPNFLKYNEKSPHPSLKKFNSVLLNEPSKKLQIPDKTDDNFLTVNDKLIDNSNSNSNHDTVDSVHEKRFPEEYESYLRISNAFPNSDSPKVVEVKNTAVLQSFIFDNHNKSYLRETDFSMKKLIENLSPLKETTQKFREKSNTIPHNNNNLGYSFIDDENENENKDRPNQNTLNKKSVLLNYRDPRKFSFNFNPVQGSNNQTTNGVIPERNFNQNESYLSSDHYPNYRRLTLNEKDKIPIKLPIISQPLINENNENMKLNYKAEPKYQYKIKQVQRGKKLRDEIKLKEIIKKEKKELEKVYRSISDAHRQQQIGLDINYNPVIENKNKIELSQKSRREFQSRLHPLKLPDFSTVNYHPYCQSVVNKQNGTIANDSNHTKGATEENNRQFKIIIKKTEKDIQRATPKILDLKNEINTKIKKCEIESKPIQQEEKLSENIYLKENPLNNQEKNTNLINLNINIKEEKKVFTENFKKLITTRLSELSAEMYKMHSALEGQIKEIELDGNKYESPKTPTDIQAAEGFCKGNITETENNKPSPGSQDLFSSNDEKEKKEIFNYSTSLNKRVPLKNCEKNAKDKYNQFVQQTPNYVYVPYKPRFTRLDYSMMQNRGSNQDSYSNKKRNPNIELLNLDKRDTFTKLDTYDPQIKQKNFGNIENRYFNIEKINHLNTNRLTTLKKYEFQQQSQIENYVNLNKDNVAYLQGEKLNTIQY